MAEILSRPQCAEICFCTAPSIYDIFCGSSLKNTFETIVCKLLAFFSCLSGVFSECEKAKPRKQYHVLDYTPVKVYDILMSSLLKILQLNTETKWPIFPRRHFQVNFLEWKCVNFDQDSTDVCSQGSNLQYCSISSDNDLAPTNDGLGWWRIYASLGPNELTIAYFTHFACTMTTVPSHWLCKNHDACWE